MASIYTANQREELAKASVYDYMYSKLNPPVSYGETFFIHTNTRRGEVTGRGDPGGISVSENRGYENWINKFKARDGWKGIQVAYALMDYYNMVGGKSYDPNSKKDFAEIISEISNDLGVSQDPSIKARPIQKIERRAPLNMLERYEQVSKSAETKPPVEIPARAQYGDNGSSPDYNIIKYMAERGIDANVARDLAKSGLVYLGEGAPYYEVARVAKGAGLFVPKKDEKGNLVYKTDENGNKIPQTFKDPKTGETRVKMQYNLVFASKDQSNKNAFYERKPMAKRGQAYIATNASPVGYFSFTGGLKDFAQVGPPEKTGKPMRAYICEAPIDAISLYCLHQKMGVKEPAEYIAISGCGKDLTVQRAICEGYDCVLAFDNDQHGKEHMDARRLQAFIDPTTNKEVSLPAIVPPKIEFDYSKYKDSKPIHVESKDWNDMLLAVVKGQNCKAKTKDGSYIGVDPLRQMSKETASHPRALIFGSVKNVRENAVNPIEPRKIVKPYELPKAEEKQKEVAREKVEALGR